ncbi:YigZ family protein [Macrococcus brunensis]|uniref:YigZ family protein n=1 Tax=Macrococcus brunensis TaxID=198483 RepID=A0A4R6BGG6_9STAP|nr:YigZ family protein [Macrococcus brunensis]TDL98930.1 YigZ family protein [Macrococcus brunensis]ULG74788.1 YigZ family protein [Macrococcus brunensis]
MENYITIKQDFETEELISKSRFITYLFKVEDEEEAKKRIAEIKSLHKSANHNCSAYTIGDQHQIQKASDDGEPSGTAGVPMLETLKKEDVHNVVAIVTRYFGGIKLGTGGLIRAYQSGVTDAIKAAGKVRIQNAILYEVTLNYDQTGRFEYDIADQPYEVVGQTYTDKVTYSIHVTAEDTEKFENFVSENTQGQGQIKKEAELMLPFPI